MTIEFLGHKKNLLQFIQNIILREATDTSMELADLFCGTASVATAFKGAGYKVLANDQLVWCSTAAEALLLNNAEPKYSGILHLIDSKGRQLFNPSAYELVLNYLNNIAPKEGFIYWNYSPASKRRCGVERMYFTEDNARRIDGIRSQIQEWEGKLTGGERALLIWDLIRAVNAVSNIAGTYGCYLKSWKKRARQPLQLKQSALTTSSQKHDVRMGNANNLAGNISCSIVYADPPYTKRQYAAYYHILETIAVGDEPELEGSTGLRPWQDKSSDYCYRKKAPDALGDLVSKLQCSHFFLSYNEDGQIPHNTILEIMKKRGVVKVFEAPYRRYKSSGLPHKGEKVVERLYHLTLI
jgi:adenine-specific DNA-methyltransferase